MDWPLRTGIFLAPFHPVGQNPTLALERDLELVVRLDELGYDEAWFGEHHSAGFEIIASPEVFIAAAAERTKHIKLGTGVSSLPYHHPLILADRIVLLDHLTRGRFQFGVGPGALPSDAFMMGIDVSRQREMMEEAFEAILALLRCDEPVTRQTDWFTLRDARLQLRPYSDFEIAVAAQVSPAGPRLAGRFGAALLSLGATSAGGFDVLGAHWDTMEERAAGFGTYLFMANEWADREATKHSYELFARYVAPRFTNQLPTLQRSRDWAAANRPQFIGEAINAIGKAITDHHAEKEAK